MATSLEHIAVIVLSGIALLAAFAAVRRGGLQRGEPVYFFTSLALGIGLLQISEVVPAPWSNWLSILGIVGVALFPVFLMSLVAQFHRVSPGAWALVGGTLVIAALYLAVSLAQVGGTSWLQLVSLSFTTFFGLSMAYGAFALLRAMFTSVGIPRRRLRIAAAGTGLLVGASLLSLLSRLVVEVRSIMWLFTIAAFLCFFFAFTPPWSVQRGWWALEVQAFLEKLYAHQATDLSVHARLAFVNLCQSARQMLGARVAVAMVTAYGMPRFLASGLPEAQHERVRDHVMRHQGLLESRDTFVIPIRRAEAADRELGEALGARILACIPITGPRGRRGTLVVGMDRPSLFVADTLRAVKLMGFQAAEALDIGEAARIQQRILMEKFTARSRSLERENKALEEASRLKSEFLANMSHELRTPLNSILGFAEVLHAGQVGSTDAVAREYIGDIAKSARHLHRIINDLLDLAKVEAGRMSFDPVTIHVRQCCEEVVASLRTDAEQKGQLIEVSVADDLTTAILDPTRLKQILYNYLSNAIKFTPAGGHIVVGARRVDGRVMRFEVKDDGPGLTEAQRGRLFRPFEQLDSSTSKRQGGTGLGLALVKRMVEAQGGTVGVESAPGKGSTFFVELPEHMVEIERTGPATGPRILVVEDEPGDRKHLETILARSGYNVDSVTNRADASARLKAAHYDAVILDLILPDGHGMTLVSEMRSQERTMLTPVIVVTVVPEEQLAWAFPIQGYISKPVRSEQLHAILRAQGIVPDNRTPALIVDANDYTAHIVAQALRKLGCASHVAGTDSAAQELMRRHTPSLVVVAIAAAPADVLRFLEWLRQEPAYAMIPVIAWAPGKIPPSERARLRLAAKHVLEENSGDLVRTLESVLTVPVAHG